MSAPAPARDRSRVRDTALSCPRCGGTPEVAGGGGLLARCRSCGVLGRIDDPEGQRRLAALPSVDAAFAEGAVKEKVRAERSAPARIRGTELVFAPYWRVQSLLVGRLTGEKHRKRRDLERTTGDNGQVFYQWTEKDDGTEPVRREIQRHVISLVAACPLDEYGIPTLDRHHQSAAGLGVKRPLHRMGEVVPFEPSLREQGTVLDPIITAQRADEEATALLEGQRRGLTAGLLPGAVVDTEIIGRERSLLFYPVYLVRFEAACVPGSAVVDAVSGKVVSVRGGHPAGTAQDRRLVGFAGLVTGLLAGSMAHVALWPPAVLAGADASSFRLGLLVAAGILLCGAYAALGEVARVLERRRP